ncbi:MAG: HIT domain-containing protein [Herpetosiphonaceae bacterium]|nr:HIT domain-containing protein [Herpetosiphonaceae bacterium]
MEIKWTPWRREYIKGTNKEEGCALCTAYQAGNDAEKLVLARGEHCYVLMNLYPYNPGHLMVTPYDHTADLANLPAAAAAELMTFAQRCVSVLNTALKPHGFNLGMNLGKPAGAGIDEHLHLHVVPRWNGDTNFMPVIGGVRLIPEAMDDTYAELKPYFAADQAS